MEGVIKENENLKKLDFGDLLNQLETFERVYPYFTNMIQHQTDPEKHKNTDVKSTMKKESFD